MRPAGRRRGGVDIIRDQRAFLVYNPGAGKIKAGGDRLILTLLSELRRHGIWATLAASRGLGTLPQVTRECVDRGADLIIACGGDGTINEVAQGLVGSDIPLGILPAGTANVLACELGFGSNLGRTIRSLPTCRPHRISAGLLTNAAGVARYFLLMAGAGLDAFIVYNISAQLKRRFGKAAYWIGGFRQLGRSLEEFHVHLDGALHRCSFALVTKVRNYGGDLEIAKKISILDDHFEIVLFEGAESYRYLKYFLGVATNSLERMSGVTVRRTRQAEFLPLEQRPVHIQVDGEYAGQLPGRVEIVPDALRLLIPPDYAARIQDWRR